MSRAHRPEDGTAVYGKETMQDSNLRSCCERRDRLPPCQSPEPWMNSVCLLQPPPSSKQTGVFDLTLVSTTALGLAFPNLTPVWLAGRGKAHRGAMLGEDLPWGSGPQKPQRIPT
ncbi:unnamed protein product [Pleuronectes platessa]|uniref:Uncharacterized protein n=1 Tax=Pleuronectes platessa TaxID=8262 RepID=A0A9N7YUH8_PLEPL|nr:unnamed protein product [Pleuronectes platessa]